MVGLMEMPTKTMGNISWWLQFTEQGMWVSPLQRAKDTTCLGWLLYSANEYDYKELCKEIGAFIGVQVALHIGEVDNGIHCKEGTTCTLVQRPCILKLIKASCQVAITYWRIFTLPWLLCSHLI